MDFSSSVSFVGFYFHKSIAVVVGVSLSGILSEITVFVVGECGNFLSRSFSKGISSIWNRDVRILVEGVTDIIRNSGFLFFFSSPRCPT